MRAVSDKRRLIEAEEHHHLVRRGFRGRLHFENLPMLVDMFNLFMRVTFIRSRGQRNAGDIRVEEVEIICDGLPGGFDGTRILLITDLHVDGSEGLAEKVIKISRELDYDFCILGGDYSFGYGKEAGPAKQSMSGIVRALKSESRVFGVLGNHDRYGMAEVLDGCGVEMLVNESVCIEKDGDKIYVAGLDDCHYYESDDLGLADGEILDGAFKIMVSHSPERYGEAAEAGYALYLAGHTHGGQVCLPRGVAIVTCATVPRRLLKGKWKQGAMAGYTSRGVGTSGVRVRFFCPPEMTIITLRRGCEAGRRC